tara:strand:- start:691 stop:840 length:150 start_codon:yes stop_codon:yes gene_type:complete
LKLIFSLSWLYIRTLFLRIQFEKIIEKDMKNLNQMRAAVEIVREPGENS